MTVASTSITVETRRRGVWPVRLLSVVGPLLPRRQRITAVRWAVRRVRVDVRAPGRRWQRIDPHLDIEVG